jgi:glycosyltransferase involved in cell wall biosynthesis
MKIAQVAPLYERVPPLHYGGTERVVSYLSEELIKQGYDVTLFASGDSVTKGRLISPCERSLRLDPSCVDPLAYHCVQLEQVSRHAASFDIIHYHSDYLHYPLSRRLGTPRVTTLHGRLNLPSLTALYKEFKDEPVVSISASQRKPLPSINWCATVHNGIPADIYKATKSPGNYLAFIGRVSPEKRVDRAIEIAKRAQMKLRIAAKVDAVDASYMEREIRPLLDHPLVEFIGEIGDAQKQDFLGQAYALLFPIDWEEPFGMVMIEAMACGTPTVAFRRGSVPEVIDDGVTGFIVDTIDEALAALDKIPNLDRRRCRRVFDARFSAQRMARDYLRVYDHLVNERGRFGRKPQTLVAGSANGRASGIAGLASNQ